MKNPRDAQPPTPERQFGPGDVLQVWYAQLGGVMREAAKHRQVVARLDAYFVEFPEEWGHVAAFLAGNDAPSAEDVRAAMAEAAKRAEARTHGGE